MFDDRFAHDLLTKYTLVFGTMFNDLYVDRTNEDGETTERIKVPLSYAKKDRMLARVREDPDIDRPYSALLPRMSFEFLGLSYDSSRKLPSVNRRVARDATDKNKFLYQYVPVPYNVAFNLYVTTKNVKDGNRIIEQILPYFTPDWTPTVELVPEMGESVDVPVVLTQVSMEDEYAADLKTRRVMVWTLSFVMKCVFYGPVKKKPVIKFSQTNLVPYGSTDRVAHVSAQPGETANGSPTTHVADSVPYSDIDVTDDWAYAIAKGVP